MLELMSSDAGAGLPHPVTAPMADDADARLSDLHILLLEDEVMIAVQLQFAMEDAGATVTYARSLSEGLAAVRSTEFDGAVLDVNLGRGQTCEAVAEILLDRGTPFILHTGDFVNKGELVERIGAPIVAKPAMPDRMIDRLAEVIAG